MNVWSELVERLLERRSTQHDELSRGARDELARAIRKEPSAFIDNAADEAFFLLAQALERHQQAARGEDLLDDEAYFEARHRRLIRLADDCRAALKVDPSCEDAALVAMLASDEEPVTVLEALLELQRLGHGNDSAAALESWTSVRNRCRLRTQAAIARTCLECGRYRMAAEHAHNLLSADHVDHLGARRTYALALARLENEPGLDALDLRFGRHGDAWLHLARTILHYKLDRMAAARRALAGFARLINGGAYALLRPIIVDTYLPDRPDAAPASYDEATMAIWEAEPIIVDVPDFPLWAATQPGIADAAQAFARRNDLDW